jgi:ADP-ribosyl-[dinitrogen reductase] hydrolase
LGKVKNIWQFGRNKMSTHQERVAGGLLGLLIGDAMGVPYEFHAPVDLPPHDEIEYLPPLGFDRSHSGVPPGTWSDDGAQALCLLASLLDCEGFDPDDFSQRLMNWYEDGYLAVDGVVFDVGVTTSRAICNLRAGIAPLQAGLADAHDNGNGSLMRVLPLALWHRGSDRDLVRDAQLQSQITHGHMRAQVCCALYCLWARRTLTNVSNPWGDAVRTLRALYISTPNALEELEWSIRPDDPPVGKGSGYVVDCLRSARMALQATNYPDVVRFAIGLGNDTDTTACVAGGIAGIRDGIAGIPLQWRVDLRGQALYQPLLNRLMKK